MDFRCLRAKKTATQIYGGGWSFVDHKKTLRTRLRSYLQPNGIIELLPTKSIIPSRFPLREDFGNLEELSQSIKKKGLIEPIIVRPLGAKFEVIAGNRRYSACKASRMLEIPSIIIQATDKEAFEIALDENIHRKNLDPIEEARAFKIYAHKYGYGSITELAKRIGKSEEYVSHRIILLRLPLIVQEKVSRRLLSASDAWELTRIKNHSDQQALADLAVSEKMTVKDVRAATDLLREGFDLLPATVGRDQRDTSLERKKRVIKAASTILRVALIRVDSLSNRVTREETDLKSMLQELRLRIHKLIDEILTEDLDEKRSTDQIGQLIREVFLSNLNSKNGIANSKLYSKSFTVFDDIPPYSLLDFEQTIKSEVMFSKKLRESHCEIEQLKINRFAGGAVATFLFVTDFKLDNFVCNWKSRVTFVFERKEEGLWSIIHEHWSPVPAREDSIQQLEQLIGLEQDRSLGTLRLHEN